MIHSPLHTKNNASYGRGSLILSTLIAVLFLTACNSSANDHSSMSTIAVDTTITTDSMRPSTSSTLSRTSSGMDELIVPGRFIGKVTLGDADTAITRRLGKPDSTDAAMGKAWLFWMSANGRERTGIFTTRNMGSGDETARAIQVLVTSPRFATTDGLHTGDSLERIRHSFPRLLQQGSGPVYDDRAAGIAFIIASNGRCTSIVVHQPGSEPQALTANLLP